MITEKLKTKKLKMGIENIKKLAIDLLVVTAGVLIALKVKEKMDSAKVTPPTTTSSTPTK
jgi:hypothetical protein